MSRRYVLPASGRPESIREDYVGESRHAGTAASTGQCIRSGKWLITLLRFRRDALPPPLWYSASLCEKNEKKPTRFTPAASPADFSISREIDEYSVSTPWFLSAESRRRVFFSIEQRSIARLVVVKTRSSPRRVHQLSLPAFLRPRRDGSPDARRIMQSRLTRSSSSSSSTRIARSPPSIISRRSNVVVAHLTGEFCGVEGLELSRLARPRSHPFRRPRPMQCAITLACNRQNHPQRCECTRNGRLRVT